MSRSALWRSSTAEAAYARDERLARAATPAVRRLFRREMRRVIRARGRSGVRVAEWEDTLGLVWFDVGAEVFTPTLDDLTGGGRRQKQQLVALIQELISDKGGARTIARFVEEASRGVVKTTRRRIQTVLRGVEQPAQAREITRALRRLYLTDFVRDRSKRIALDQVLKASATFEHAAALVAQETTGREYVQVWRTQGDQRVRASHEDADGQEVALGESFKVGGVLLRYPRDPAGPGRETYGCRCWAERRRL